MGEVGVQVADVGRGEQRVGERDRLQQLLDVDLARTGQRRAAVAQRLAAARAERAREAARASARDAPQRGHERRQVPRPPAVQRGGERRRVGQVLRLGGDRVDDGMAQAALALLDAA